MIQRRFSLTSPISLLLILQDNSCSILEHEECHYELCLLSNKDLLLPDKDPCLTISCNDPPS